METVKIGLIGPGMRLQGVLDILFKDNPWIKVTAINDPNPDVVKSCLEKYNPKAKVYDDHKELAKDPDIKWVFIGSWNAFHREQAIAAMEAGKNVFCEKPLATTFEDCIAMKEAWEKTGKIFFIGFTLRYAPLYVKLRELLDEKAIGDIISMEFNETLNFNHGGYIHRDWRRLTKYAGTHLLEKCCHDIDLVHWMVDSLPTKVASFGGLDFFTPENKKHMDRVGPRPSDGAPAFCAWPCKHHPDPFTGEKDIVDNQVAIIQFANGVRTTFHTNCCAGIPERRMYILGSEGCIRGELYTGVLELQKYGWDEPKMAWRPGEAGGHGGGDEFLCQQIADTIKSNTPSISSLTEGLKSAITCFAMDQAMETQKVVDLADMWQRAGIEIY